MKTLGITGRLEACKDYPEIRECLDIRWSSLLKQVSMIPVFLPLGISDIECYIEHFDLCGVILTGGNQVCSIDSDNLNYQREVFEYSILKLAKARSLPVLGICRGAQCIAEFFGARIQYIENHVAVEHTVEINESARFWGSNNESTMIKVNSYHNYGITKIPEHLNPVALAEDGSIEAFEHLKYPFFGQMWHPERYGSFKETDLNIIKRIFI